VCQAFVEQFVDILKPIILLNVVDSTTSRPDDRIGLTTQEENMDDLLTIEEIEARYAPEWVLIGEPQTDETLQLRAGKVLFHGLD
jgi:hypothetical protein